MKKGNTTTAAAAAAKNEAAREKMRANLAALEKRAADILAKGDAMTAADRMELLTLVNVAYHSSGKIEGVFSIDGCACCEFCEKMRQAGAADLLLICRYCYAAADSWKEAAWRRHTLNMRILSTVEFTADELRNVSIPGNLCRINEDGDTPNYIYAANILRIALTHPLTHFGYWFKNRPAVEEGLRHIGITTRDALPDNVRFIQSSLLIGIPADPAWFADAVFTVYPDEATTAAAIAAGAHECNGRKCMACGFQCYLMQRRENPLYIAEFLRCNKAQRAAVMAAYRARVGA